jgi:hypothetical protein
LALIPILRKSVHTPHLPLGGIFLGYILQVFELLQARISIGVEFF